MNTRRRPGPHHGSVEDRAVSDGTMAADAPPVWGPPLPLRFLLPLTVAVLGLTLVAVSTWSQLRATKEQLTGQMVERAQLLGDHMAGEVAAVLRNRREHLIPRILEHVNEDPSMVRARLLGADGELLASHPTGSAGEPEHLSQIEGETLARVRASSGPAWATDHDGEHLVMIYPLPVRSGPESLHPDARAHLILHHEIGAAWEDARKILLYREGSVAILIVFLCGIFYALLDRILLRRVRHLVAASRAHAAGEVAHFRFEGRDELAELSRSLEQMAARARRQARALRGSRSRLIMSLEAAGQGSWELDLDHDVVHLDPSWARHEGLSTPTLRGGMRAVLRGLHPEDRRKMRDALGAHISGRMPYFEAEVRVLETDGRISWRRYKGRAVEWDEKGSPRRLAGIAQDITEQRAAEDLRRHFESVMENGLTEFYVVDGETGRFEYANPAAVANLGYSLEELRNMRPQQISDPAVSRDDAEVLQELFTDTLRRRSFSTRHVRRDGTTYDVHLDLQGVVLGERQKVVATAVDVSERVAAQETERQLRSLVQASPDYVALADAGGRLSYLNPAARDFLGLPPDDQLALASLDADELPFDGRRGFFSQVIRPVLEADDRWTGEVYLDRVDGARRILDCQVMVHRDARGETAFLSGFAKDVTEQRQAEADLRETKHLLETVFESIGEAILVVDRETRVVRMCNAATESIFGFRKEELLDRSVSRLFEGQDRYKWARDAVDRQLDDSGQARTDVAMRHADGRAVHTEATVSLLHGGDGQGEGTGEAVVAVIRDVTERRRAEEALRSYALRLQSLSQQIIDTQERERGRIARELHDEFGQTLTALKLGLEVLRIDEGLSGENRRVMEECSAMIGHLMHDVRSLSLDLRPSLLDDLGLEAALNWYVRRQAEISGTDIRIETDDLDDVTQAQIQTTVYRLVQESVTNALRHADAERIRIRIVHDEAGLSLEVSDDGRGFDAEARLGDARAGASSGLSGMHERVDLVGGELRFDSRLGTGTRVIAHLPLEVKVPELLRTA